MVTLFACKQTTKPAQIHTTTKRLLDIRVGDRVGFIDTSGKMIINPQFDGVLLNDKKINIGVYAVRMVDKVGFIDTTGKYIINPQFDVDTSQLPFEFWNYGFTTSGLSAVKVKDKWGFINLKGEMVLKPIYTDVDMTGFSEGLAGVKVKDKWGYIDSTGKFIIPEQFEFVDGFENGIAEIREKEIVTKGKEKVEIYKTGYINKKGKIIWKPSN